MAGHNSNRLSVNGHVLPTKFQCFKFFSASAYLINGEYESAEIDCFMRK